MFEKIKYPKFLLLITSFIFAYFLFQFNYLSIGHNLFLRLGYFGTFFSGLLLSYGFTAASGLAILLIITKSQNIFFASIIGGLGALCGDLLIFNFLRYSFKDEIKKLSQEKIIKKINKKFPNQVKRYFLLIVGGFIISSPLPDEIGISLLAASKTISQRIFILLSFLLNTLGILIIILLGKVI